MLRRSRISALVLLIATFVAGGAMGWLARGSIDRGDSRHGRHRVDAIVGHLAKELHLTQAQEDSVRAILDRRRAETRALWQEMHPRYTLLRDRARAEVLLQLSAEQVTRYRKLIEDMDKQTGKADSTRGRRDESR